MKTRDSLPRVSPAPSRRARSRSINCGASTTVRASSSFGSSIFFGSVATPHHPDLPPPEHVAALVGGIAEQAEFSRGEERTGVDVQGPWWDASRRFLTYSFVVEGDAATNEAAMRTEAPAPSSSEAW